MFWQDEGGLVHRRYFDPQGKPHSSPTTTSTVPVLSWEVAPLGNAGLRTVTRMPDGRYFFRDLGMRAGDPGAPRVSPTVLANLPDGMPSAPQFTFCTTGEGVTKIVTAAANKLWAATIAETAPTAWAEVGEVTTPLYVHAFSPRGRTCWVEWLEKDIGLRRAALP